MTELDILATLNSQMVNFGLANPTLDIVYPNKEYNPVKGKDYVAVSFLPANSVSACIGLDAKNRCTGIYQVTINVDSGKGHKETKDILDSLQSFFKRSTEIIYLTTKVRITKFNINTHVEDPDWFRTFVSITYRSDIEN